MGAHTEGENDDFPQPETPTWNPGHFISTSCYPVGTPPHTTRAGDPNVTARPAVGPPGYNTGLGMHFTEETKPGPITLHCLISGEESSAGPNIHQEGVTIQPTGRLGLPSTSYTDNLLSHFKMNPLTRRFSNRYLSLLKKRNDCRKSFKLSVSLFG